MQVKGKVALITGGGTGIGRSTALKLAENGANICINYAHSEKEATETMNDCIALGVKAKIYKANVANDDEVRAMFKSACEDFGRLDILVNSAGTTRYVDHADLEGLKAEYFDDIFDINVKGLFFCCRAAEKPLKENGGVIINITSIAGVTGLGSSMAYAASKAAAISLNKSLARVMAPEVRVISIAPGIVLTRWVDGQDAHIKRLSGTTPLQKIARPEDIADTVYALIVHGDMITGQNLIVDGGAFI